MDTHSTNDKDLLRKFNRVGYAGMLLVSVQYLVLSNAGYALAAFGFALLFNPFGARITLTRRMTWRRTWMLAHVALVFLLLSYQALA